MTAVATKPEYYGRVWQKMNSRWWHNIHVQRPWFHEFFKDWLSERIDQCETVLEVGCGSGVYPIHKKELFKNAVYTGLDISESAIFSCRENSDLTFLLGDFLTMDLPGTFDLVFSHAVIDHIYDPDEFVRRIVAATNKYALINAYAGFHPDLTEHDMVWDKSKFCYQSRLSPARLRDVLLESLSPSEFSIFEITGPSGVTETIIEVTKI